MTNSERKTSGGRTFRSVETSKAVSRAREQASNLPQWKKDLYEEERKPFVEEAESVRRGY